MQEKRKRQDQQIPELVDEFVRLDRENEDLKNSVASLTREKAEMAAKAEAVEKDRDALKAQNTELEQRIETLQASHKKSLSDTKEQLQVREKKVQALERENRSLRTQKEGIEDEAARLRQRLQQLISHLAQLEKSKAQAENSGRELQQQLQTSHTKLVDLEQKLKLSAAESERLQRECQDLQTKRADLEKLLKETTALSERLQTECQDLHMKRADLEKLLKEITAKSEQFQIQSEDLEKKKAALELELETQAPHFARMMASKEKERSEMAKRAQAAEKSLAATERRLGVLKAEQQEKLEQLQTNVSTIQELLGQQTDRQANVLEGVAFLVQRQKEKDLHLGSVLTSLELELRELCVRIERHVGCHGVEFSERLMRGHHDPRDDEIWRHHGFLTRRSFWCLVGRWTTVSLLPDSQAPLTLRHLQQVCASLQPDPRSVQSIRGAHEAVLEKNFVYLSEQLDFDVVLDHVISFAGLNEHARQFLRDESLKTRFQKTARLLDVVYSLGEAGYRQLRDVMGSSGHDHVLPLLPQDADVTNRKDTDRRRTEAVADAGPDDDGNVNSVVAVDDDNADDEGPGEWGDEGALTLHDEDRRPASARELRGLMGNMAAMLRDRDQVAARDGERLAELVTAVEQRLDGTLREIGTMQERMVALNGGVMQAMEERLNAAVREMHATAGMNNGRVMSDFGARVEDVRSAQERMSDSVAAMEAKLRESHDMVTERMNAAERSSSLLRESVLEQMERLEERLEERQNAAAERLEGVCRQLEFQVKSVIVAAREREERQPGSLGEVSSQSAGLSDMEVLNKRDGGAGKKNNCCCF